MVLEEEVYDWMVVGSVDYGYLTRSIQLGSLDLCDELFELRGTLMEELEGVLFNPNEPRKFFKIGKLLPEPLQTRLIEFIRAHKGDFAWTPHEIPGNDPTAMVHKLNVGWEARPIKQKRRSFNP